MPPANLLNHACPGQASPSSSWLLLLHATPLLTASVAHYSLPIKTLQSLCSGLRPWSVNSSGPTSVINLSSPTLQAWWLVSWVLISATSYQGSPNEWRGVVSQQKLRGKNGESHQNKSSKTQKKKCLVNYLGSEGALHFKVSWDLFQHRKSSWI